MKNTIKIFSAIAFGAFVLSGCIKETFPESNAATSEQVGASATALDGAMAGLPAQLTQSYPILGSSTQQETDIAYPSFMMTYEEMIGNIYPGGSNVGYDWFRRFNTNENMGDSYTQIYVPWRALYMFIKSANDIIGAVNEETASASLLAYAGMAYVYRAFWYYHAMNLYEPKENPYTDVSAVLGLTVPIVTDQTLEADGKNNPRAKHADMVEFILSDLDKAEKYLAEYTPATKMYPSLAVAYGVRAKVLMSDKQYAQAAEYARKAIDAFGGSPVTEAQWLDVTTGFVKANQAWMWYTTYSAEGMGNLANWIGWASAEADWGYSSLTKPMIDRALYDRIAYTDFRKHAFLDPDRSVYDYQTCRADGWLDSQPDYLSLKFRCVDGDFETYSVGAVCDVPMMRVEEMYLIEAEATGLSAGVAAGVSLLESFMKAYRQSDYSCAASSEAEFEDEILTQKRIEFWGEGIALFDAKRMGAGCRQSYEGTNAPGDAFKLNCEVIKPNWNLVIPRTEVSNNVALEGYNNPDPTGTVKPDLTW